MTNDVKLKIDANRVWLSLPSPNQAEAVVRYLQKNREHLANSGPAYADDYFTIELWQKRLAENQEQFAAGNSVRTFVFRKDDSEIIGNVALDQIVRRAAQYCYMGYGIDSECEGKGYMKEAVNAIVNYGFDELNIHRIMANYQPHNVRSGKLLKTLGFAVEGYARDYLRINGEWQDHIMTALINQNWRPE